MPTTAIVYERDGLIVSEETNYQGFTYDPGAGICTPTNDRAKRKWETLKDFYPELVCGKTVIDLGANFGFLCFKALEHGANACVAVESSGQYIRPIKELCNRLEPRIAWYMARFPQETRSLKADVVVCLSLLHHVFPKSGSLELILHALYGMANEAVILEWISPEDRAIVRKGWGPEHPEYSKAQFLHLCRARFNEVVPLGQGHHETRMIYLLQKGER